MFKIKRKIERLTAFSLPLNWNCLKLKFFPTPKNLKRKDDLIKKQLYQDLNFIFDDLPNREEKIHHHKIVWVMWQQGFSTAPSLVRLCRKTLDKFLPKNVQVVELDDINLCQYVDVPSIIQEKYSKGIISRAHYSDIIRCLILKEYGGIWIDSTVLLTGNIDGSIFDKKFWTVKQHRPVVSNFRWSTYAMGGTSDLLFSALSDLLIQYWSLYNIEIDYLFMDYLIDLIRENDPRINQMINAVPINNDDVLSLNEVVYHNGMPQEIDKLLSGNTKIFKMTYRLNEDTDSYHYFLDRVKTIIH